MDGYITIGPLPVCNATVVPPIKYRKAGEPEELWSIIDKANRKDLYIFVDEQQDGYIGLVEA